MIRNERIYIRLSPSEKKLMERAAVSYGYDVSTFLRTMTEWVVKTQPRLIVEPEPIKEPA